jgi:hypothetical protein
MMIMNDELGRMWNKAQRYFKATYQNFPGRLKNTTKNYSGLPTEIQSEDLSNTMQNC